MSWSALVVATLLLTSTRTARDQSPLAPPAKSSRRAPITPATIAAAASNTATRTSKLAPDHARRRAAHRCSRDLLLAASGDMLPPMRGFPRSPPSPQVLPD